MVTLELVVDIDDEKNVDNPDANTLVVDSAVVKDTTAEFVVEIERPTLTLLFKMTELKLFSMDIALDVSSDNWEFNKITDAIVMLHE